MICITDGDPLKIPKLCGKRSRKSQSLRLILYMARVDQCRKYGVGSRLQNIRSRAISGNGIETGQ
jgi:hypothetical protein